MLRFSCVFLLFAAAYAGTVKFTDCGHTEVTEVRVNGCSVDSCVLKKGLGIHFEIDFTANQYTEDAQIVLIAESKKVTSTGSSTNSVKAGTNVCQTGLPCPLKKGEKYTLKYDMVFDNSEPSISTNITFKLTSDNGSLMACGMVKGEVQY